MPERSFALAQEDAAVFARPNENDAYANIWTWRSHRGGNGGDEWMVRCSLRFDEMHNGMPVGCGETRFTGNAREQRRTTRIRLFGA